MSSSFEPLIPATLELNPDGTPVSRRFDDIYYAGSVPLAQARHVFVGGNQLPERWRGRTHFTVLETGFGLGHNFLALWDTWRRDPQRCDRLHMVSVEAHPFKHCDLSLLYGRLDSSLQPLAQQLLEHWPELTPGIHRLELDGGAVTLTLALGGVVRLLPELQLTFDACFLDGFSPRVNPEMWTPQIFRQLARLGCADATLATWCSAGQVRRDLEDAGFLVQRLPGFGTKRHRIVAQLRPGMGKTRSVAAPSPRVAVVGGGFAGAAAAYALAARGGAVTVFDPAFSQGPAGTHRDHRGGAMTPVVSRDDDIRARLSRTGVFLAGQRWANLDAAARPQRCGTFQRIDAAEGDAWKQALQRLSFPETFVRWVDAEEASALTGVRQQRPGLWHGHGHLVRPESFLDGLLTPPLVATQARHVARLGRSGHGEWLLYNEDGDVLACADWVVLAASWLVPRLLSTIPGLVTPGRLQTMRRVGGQLSYFSMAGGTTLKSVVSGGGLCLPDAQGGLVGGSTYVPDTTLSIMTRKGHQENRNKVMALFADPTMLGWPRPLADGWAGWRAAVRDRRPVIGSVAGAPGLWLACGFGSRGLTWSALAAEVLAATLNHEPLPLERGLVQRIAPV